MTVSPATPLYLSMLFLNPRSRQVMSEIAQPYEMHRTLMRAFPGANENVKSKARDEFGVIFRAEVDGIRGAVRVYVQSRVAPNWCHLHRLNDYLYIDEDTPGHEYKDIMPAYRKIRNGQVLSFRLRANPTKRVAKKDDTLRGKRVELRCEEEQIAWLIRKGQEGNGVPGGFDLLMKEHQDADGEERLIPHVNVRPEGKQMGRKKDAGGMCKTTHLAVLFDGLLRVTDTDLLLATIVRGIGAGKAFGFGLLSVAPTNALNSEDLM